MKLSAIDVGKQIRETIQKEAIKSEPIKIKIPKLEIVKEYRDRNGIKFLIGSTYNGYKVVDIVKCTYANKGEKRHNLGMHYPVNKKEQILRSDGTNTNMQWHKFKNKYRFEKVNQTITADDDMFVSLIYNTPTDKTTMNTGGNRANKAFYNGIILESILFARSNKNIIVLKTQYEKQIREVLNDSTFWHDDGKVNGEITYKNKSLGVQVWKMNDAWVMTSISSANRIRHWKNGEPTYKCTKTDEKYPGFVKGYIYQEYRGALYDDNVRRLSVEMYAKTFNAIEFERMA